MSSVIEKLEREQLRRLPDFRSGDRVRVHLQVVEGSRRRTQVFEGVVIARAGHGVRETVTVRKQSFGVGVERVFPLHSPKIEKIEVAGRGDVRRAKLYYLRDRIGKRARVRERTDLGPEQEIQRELLEGPLPVEEEAVEVAEADAVAESVEGSEASGVGVETEAAAADEDGSAPEADEADSGDAVEPTADGAEGDDGPVAAESEGPVEDDPVSADDASDGEAPAEDDA